MITEAAERIARLEEKVENLREDVQALIQHVDKLRSWQAYLLGAGAVIGALVSWLAARWAR